MEPIKWWGYIHTNGTVQVKRYFGKLDLEEARDSPFVKEVSAVFEAEGREDAVAKVLLDLKKPDMIPEGLDH